MGELGIRGATRARNRFTTRADPTAVRAPDLVKRDFTACRPDATWVADFTYCSTWSGIVYVSFVVDVFSRGMVGWQASRSIHTDLALDALEMALWRRRAKGLHGLVHHSDRGTQYLAIRYSERLAEAGIAASVGSRGDSYENALAESFQGLYKTELIRHRGPWRGPGKRNALSRRPSLS